MGKLVIDQSKVSKDVADKLMKLCPFGGFEYDGKTLGFTAGCRVCKLCVRKGPEGVVRFLEEEISKARKSIKPNGGVLPCLSNTTKPKSIGVV